MELEGRLLILTVPITLRRQYHSATAVKKDKRGVIREARVFRDKYHEANQRYLVKA